MTRKKLEENLAVKIWCVRKFGCEFPSMRIIVFKINASIKLASCQKFKKMCHLVYHILNSKNIQVGEFWE